MEFNKIYDSNSKRFFPIAYTSIQDETLDSGFTMASDPLTGSLLKTLAATKKVEIS